MAAFRDPYGHGLESSCRGMAAREDSSSSEETKAEDGLIEEEGSSVEKEVVACFGAACEGEDDEGLAAVCLPLAEDFVVDASAMSGLSCVGVAAAEGVDDVLSGASSLSPGVRSSMSTRFFA